MSTELLELSAEETAIRPLESGMGILGLEEMPMSFVALPRVRIVQPGSLNVSLADGEHDARKGFFFYDHSQEETQSVRMAIIKAKPFTRTGPSLDDPNKVETKQSVGVLFYDLGKDQVCTITLRPGSFSGWRSLMAVMLNAHKQGSMDTAFSREVTAVTDMIKGKANTYYVARFSLGNPLTDEELVKATAAWEQYESYFDAPEVESEDESA